ncbi:DUF433 domain-containing protein [Leeuwenhoekiella sp. H156]|uniref:DUF433 domain-containing protein n=1 Tax=Leeuwenhoekiella sp. H156 TaxID=3450128 RepID=UPI003FA42FCA
MSETQEIIDIGNGFYTISDIAGILSIPRTKVSYLVRKYWNGKIKNYRNHNFIYDIDGALSVNFQTLIELKVFYTLKEFGISYQKVFEVHKFLSEEINTNYPFAHSTLYASGSDILFEYRDKTLIKADSAKQLAIRDIIEPFSQKIEYNSKKIAKAFYPLGKKHNVIVDPVHQFGEPTIKGTNILTSTIYQMYKDGDTIDLISEIYQIDNLSIKDAIEFHEKAA